MTRTFKHWPKLLGIAWMALAFTAKAQTFPNKTLNMVVAFPAGGPSDVIGRIVAKGMQESLGQTIIVENVTGVGGALGVLKVANAPADGHTILAGSPLELIYTPLGVAAAKNKPEDVRMAALVGRTTMVIAVRKDLPVNTLAEFVAYASKSAQPLSFGSTGVGSLYHLMAERALQIGHAKGLHVPYNGLAPYLKDLIGGTLDWGILPVAGPVPGAIDAGQVKAIAIAHTESVPRLPKVVPARQTKGFEDYNFSIWLGIQTGSRVPDAVVASIHKAAYTSLANPDVRKSIEASGTVIADPMSLSQLDAFYKREASMGAAMAKSINLQAQ